MTGEEAARAVAEASRRTISRRELGRHQRFEQVSSEVGELDEDAFAEALAEDPDEALALLADMAAATDEKLRRLARSLAGRIFTDLARRGAASRSGAARLTRARADRAEGDLDLERSLDHLVEARAAGSAVEASELVVTTWRRPDTALCLLVDRSGSMQGSRLATAAISAAAALYSRTADSSVIAFADEPIVLKEQNSERSAGAVVDDLLALRGSGVTNLAAALRTARNQLATSNAARKVTIVLSDCRVTAGGDAVPQALLLDEVVVLAPAEDTADAEEFARRTGCRWAPLSGAGAAPLLLNQLLSER